MKIMISACLMGENCKYNGGNNLNDRVLAFVEGAEIVRVCPEIMGGLKAPRKPCEIVNSVVMTSDGNSVDREFRLGAERALMLAKKEAVDMVILQPRSPSCGINQIYDGSFSGVKISGHGIFAQMLIDNGFKVIDATDIEKMAFHQEKDSE